MTTQILRSILLGTTSFLLLYAQSDTGRITGTVSDASGAVVPRAAVSVKNEKTGETRKVTANDQGIYLVTQLGPAAYTITSVVAGMAPAEYSGVTLQVG